MQIEQSAFGLAMSRTEDVLRAYELWDPEHESSTELAERLGISKARLYQILNSQGVTPKARRPRGVSLSERDIAARTTWDSTRTADELTRRGVQSLLEELEELRTVVTMYRNRYGPLDS